MAIKLSTKAYSAFRLLEQTTYKERAAKLGEGGEWGFALILYWNQIEAALKLTRYGCNIEEWPDKLDFVNANWGPLKRLKTDSSADYDLVFGTVGTSLKNRRNGIAHEGLNLSAVEYSKYLAVARWAILSLKKEVPKVEKLREKKRRLEMKATVKSVWPNMPQPYQ
jgi:hypothetical protein